MPPLSIDYTIIGARPEPAVVARAASRSWLTMIFAAPFEDIDDRAARRAQGRQAEREELKALKAAERLARRG
jgi:hypothetical protein